METYDFGIYGLLAAYLAVEFFASTNSTASLLITWAVFAIPFAIRPLGGLVLGAIGDRVGRKKVMLFSIAAIALATAAIGVIPSAATIGIAAPLAVLAARVLQGFVYGGETANAITFVGEWTPARRRASRLAWVQCGSSAGQVFGSVLAFALSASLGPALMQAWGWRILFVVALPLAAVGIYIRFKIDETPAFRALQAEGTVSANPVRSTFSDPATRTAMAQCFLLGALFAAGFYTIYIQLPAYLVREVGFSGSEGLLLTLVGLVFLLICTPIWGYAADRFGRRGLGLWSSVVVACMVVPCFMLISGHGGLGIALTGILLLTLVYSAQNALALGTIFEVLTTRTRSTAFSISWGVCAALFGGAAPFVSTALVAATGWAAAPALIVVVAAACSAAGYLWFRERPVLAT
ncbi:MFS transporter [Pseudonocardia kujensis]|nr:MFS transporter [Pseudonocardia kujensis]MCE0765575.1 MFS transporter [Pseudonocardia kujensis]